VDAPIEQVGVTSEGDMDVPKQQFDTAWYKLGPRPGEIGSAVIAGHKDWKNGESAIFADLHKLQPGDKVVVEDDRGLLITYVVRTSRGYNPDSDATDVFRSNDGRAHLNLITCEGLWDKNAKSYSQRLIVFTDKE
jgi:sortase A